LSKNRKPWVSSTTVTAPNALTIRPANSKHMSIDSALMWNSRSPGVAGAWWRGPRSSMNGVSSAGRGPENRRSQASDPIEVTTERCLSVSRKPTARTNPDMSGSPSWTEEAASCPSSMVTTRKMAAGVNGAVTGCGSGSGTIRP
jgi:hypothetical protein